MNRHDRMVFDAQGRPYLTLSLYPPSEFWDAKTNQQLPPENDDSQKRVVIIDMFGDEEI